MATTKKTTRKPQGPAIERPRAIRVPMTPEELDEAHVVAVAARCSLTTWIRSALRAEYLRITKNTKPAPKAKRARGGK